jgi:hypothetical protein
MHSASTPRVQLQIADAGGEQLLVSDLAINRAVETDAQVGSTGAERRQRHRRRLPRAPSGISTEFPKTRCDNGSSRRACVRKMQQIAAWKVRHGVWFAVRW